MQKRKIYLASFASFNFHPASFRFYNQALDMGIFENIFIYNETNLDMDYKRHFKDKIYIESNLKNTQDSKDFIESNAKDSKDLLLQKNSQELLKQSNNKNSKQDSKPNTMDCHDLHSSEFKSRNDAKKDSKDSIEFTPPPPIHPRKLLSQIKLFATRFKDEIYTRIWLLELEATSRATNA
ncbi:hypothetical protein DCO60_01500 [Helicobacter saguini]|uniref:hypothetical protein n=1 Tax=Helicobacter saguini TaxID=1548018 RepID=UPI000E59B82C|nr:hypothetical protein [Helicobacter saguini]MWV61164.1 hypothetical protein [Helicobacter saguini]